MRVLKELNSGQYERTMVSQSEKGELLRLSSSKTNFKKDTLLIFNYLFMIFINRHFRKAHLDPWKWKNHQRRPYHQVRAASLSPLNFSASLSGEPTMWYIWFLIRFDHTPLATPNGDILIRDLSFEVRSTWFLQIVCQYRDNQCNKFIYIHIKNITNCICI